MGITYSKNRHSNDGKTCPPMKWDTECKINIFESRVRGWTFDVTDLLNPIRHHYVNYARLSIVICYFEMIGLYLDGITSDLINAIRRTNPARDTSRFQCKNMEGNRNEDYFKKGLFDVAEKSGWDMSEVNKASKILYPALRCGLYHGGMARHGIWVSDTRDGPPFDVKDSDVTIAPTPLIEGIKNHFRAYIDELRLLNQSADKSESEENKLTCFERRFDIEVVDKLQEKYNEVYRAT